MSKLTSTKPYRMPESVRYQVYGPVKPMALPSAPALMLRTAPVVAALRVSIRNAWRRK